MITAADLFCGAGGSSLGAHWAGVKILVAMNHWGLAIESHSLNFGDTVHVLGKAEWANLEALKGVDLLMASPECTRHSTAAGKLKWTPEAEGSRATAWQVYRYAKELSPRWLVVENVRQIQLWSEYKKWVRSIQLLGYNIRTQLLNAADFGVPQNRIRWFLLADKERQPLEVKPTTTEHMPAYRIIDWSTACPSIFSRSRELAPNTMKRILIGLKRFCTKEQLEPFMVTLRTNSTAHSLNKPAGTVTAGGVHHGIVMPYLLDVPFGHGRKRDENEARVHGLGKPVGSIIGSNRFAFVVPYVVSVNHAGANGGRVRNTKAPLWTVTTSNGVALVTPFIVAYYSGGGQVHTVSAPTPTVVTKDRLGVVAPFILHQQVGGTPRSLTKTMPTIMTKSSHGLVMPMLEGWEPPKLPARGAHGLVKFMQENAIVDIGFRMLQPTELKRAMGFPDEYIIKGGKTDVVRQLGNAVPPPVMRAIVETLCIA